MVSSNLDFESIHILVIGDVMLDRYWHGLTSRISPEAPVPIVHIKQQEERPGGAGNVALNLRALGGQVTLIGVTGTDETATHIINSLTAQGVRCAFVQLSHISTITKLRILSRHQQLIRLDFEENFFESDIQKAVQLEWQNHINQCDIVILSDYGKGTLTDCTTLIHFARAAQKPVLVDPKGRDFSRYQGATIITPNLTEFEAVVGVCQNQTRLVEKGEALCQHLQLEALLITQSQDGMTLLRPGYPALHLPAHACEVFDVTGAGDTVISVLAAALAMGQDWSQATQLANLAAGLVVAKLGAATVNLSELKQALNPSYQGIQNLTTLKTIVQSAQAKGKIVVMTNGCFDILHAGHVQYLTQARQLGDYLIVAVNDDDSVHRLKGKNRPIHSLEQRMTILNTLECVDWVIPFSEDTPEELICQILPNILVKGGDYQIHDIAGSDCVLANGGQVLSLDFLEGCSTTTIIETLQQTTTGE